VLLVTNRTRNFIIFALYGGVNSQVQSNFIESRVKFILYLSIKMSHNPRPKKNKAPYIPSEVPFSKENRFNGNKLEFTKLMREIEQAVRSNPLTVEYVDYLSGVYKRREDLLNPSVIYYDMPYRFTIQAIPEPLADRHDRFNERMALIKLNREHNRGVAAFKATLYSMLCERCAESFNTVFAAWGHEPYGIIDYLYSNYGNENLSQSESCANVYIFIMFKFDSSRRLTEERMRYQLYIDLLKISEEMQLAMLRATKDEWVPFQLLPDRLIPSLRYTIEHNYSLEDTWSHLITVDTDQHTRGHLSSSIKHSGDHGATVAAVRQNSKHKTMTCHNCGKKGHISPNCPTASTCDNCGKRGHTASDCKSSNKKPQHSGKGTESQTKKKNGTKPSKGQPSTRNGDESDSPEEEDDPQEKLYKSTSSPSKGRGSTKLQVNQVDTHSPAQINALIQRVAQLEKSHRDEAYFQRDSDDESESEEEPDLNQRSVTGRKGAYRLMGSSSLGAKKRRLGVNVIRALLAAAGLSRALISSLKLDSGADIHITCSTKGMINVTVYTVDDPCPLIVETADGGPLHIIARGDYNEFLTGVYVCEDVVGTLISLQQLQNVGLGVTFPSPLQRSQLGNRVGAIIHTDEGEIVGVTDPNYEMPLESFHHHGFFMRSNEDNEIVILNSRCRLVDPGTAIDIMLTPSRGKRKRGATSSIFRTTDTSCVSSPDGRPWSDVTRKFSSNILRNNMHLSPPLEVMKACVFGIYGYGLDCIKNIRDLVRFVQCTFMCEEKYLIRMAENPAIKNFLVTADQIKKYFSTLPAWTLSHMRERNTRDAAMNNPTERRELHLQPQAFLPPKSRKNKSNKYVPVFVEDRNLDSSTAHMPKRQGPEYNIPGYRSHSDVKGWGNTYVAVFMDSATGYVKSYNMASQGKKQLAEVMERWIMFHQGHGHSVRIMVSDSENIYRAMNHRVLQRYQIRADFSPAYRHQLNGNIERMIGILQNIALGVMIQANWLAPSFWTAAWHFAAVTLNLRKSRAHTEAVTRFESITGRIPDLRRYCLLPFGIVVAYRVKKIKADNAPFPLHCNIGFYLGPVDGTDGAIVVWSLISQRELRAGTWRILQKLPSIFRRYNHTTLFEHNVLAFTDTDDDVSNRRSNAHDAVSGDERYFWRSDQTLPVIDHPSYAQSPAVSQQSDSHPNVALNRDNPSSEGATLSLSAPSDMRGETIPAGASLLSDLDLEQESSVHDSDVMVEDELVATSPQPSMDSAQQTSTNFFDLCLTGQSSQLEDSRAGEILQRISTIYGKRWLTYSMKYVQSIEEDPFYAGQSSSRGLGVRHGHAFQRVKKPPIVPHSKGIGGPFQRVKRLRSVPPSSPDKAHQKVHSPNKGVDTRRRMSIRMIRATEAKSSHKRGPYVHHPYWNDETKYWDINGLGNTYDRWHTEGTRHSNPDDYTMEMFEILQESEQFHYLVEHIYSMTPGDRIQVLSGSDEDVHEHPLCSNIPRWNRQISAHVIRGLVADIIEHVHHRADTNLQRQTQPRRRKNEFLDDTPVNIALLRNLSEDGRLGPRPILSPSHITSLVRTRDSTETYAQAARHIMEAIPNDPGPRILEDPVYVSPSSDPQLFLDTPVTVDIMRTPVAIQALIPVLGKNQWPQTDMSLIWPEFFDTSDTNTIPSIDVDELYLDLFRLEENESTLLAIGPSLLEGADLGLYAVLDIPKGTRMDIYTGPQYGPMENLEEFANVAYPHPRSGPNNGIYDSLIDGPRRYTITDFRSYAYYANDPISRPDLVNAKLVWDQDLERGVLISTDTITRGEEIYLSYGADYWYYFQFTLPEALESEVRVHYCREFEAIERSNSKHK